MVGPASAPLGDPIASTARAASAPLRTTAAAPGGASLAPAPKHAQGTFRACARTSATVNPASIASATTPGTGPHNTTSATATASSTPGRPRPANAPSRSLVIAPTRRRTSDGARSFATADTTSAPASTTRAASATDAPFVRLRPPALQCPRDPALPTGPPDL